MVEIRLVKTISFDALSFKLLVFMTHRNGIRLLQALASSMNLQCEAYKPLA
jgi:hypothetical protein